jgi:CRISPR system Cascade subunit CasC
MFVEFHILQSFPPSCLNRDDTNTPKDCIFGGVRRARVSSQAWKRAIRMAFKNENAVKDSLAVRTKRLVEAVTEELASLDHSGDRVGDVVKTALGAAGIKTVEGRDLTQYLLFLPRRAAERLAKVIADNYDAIEQATPAAGAEKADKKEKKKEKAEAREALSADLSKQLTAALQDAALTPDLALFGRMVADAPDHNVDAAAQVAHAISTNAAAPEFDFYTALDDLKGRDEDAGADMMGTIGFTAPCLYRYAVVDTAQLERNLARGGKVTDEVRRLAGGTLAAFARGMVNALPSARQNSFAAHTPPSLVVAVVRDGGQPVSLANAFEAAVKPRGDKGVVDVSIEKFGAQWEAITRALGGRSVRYLGWVNLTTGPDTGLEAQLSTAGVKPVRASDLVTLIDGLARAVEGVS